MDNPAPSSTRTRPSRTRLIDVKSGSLHLLSPAHFYPTLDGRKIHKSYIHQTYRGRWGESKEEKIPPWRDAARGSRKRRNGVTRIHFLSSTEEENNYRNERRPIWESIMATQCAADCRNKQWSPPNELVQNKLPSIKSEPAKWGQFIVESAVCLDELCWMAPSRCVTPKS